MYRILYKTEKTNINNNLIIYSSSLRGNFDICICRSLNFSLDSTRTLFYGENKILDSVFHIFESTVPLHRTSSVLLLQCVHSHRTFDHYIFSQRLLGSCLWQ